MKSLNYLIKPASSLCNMGCKYCFYEDEAAHRQAPSMGMMTLDTAEHLIHGALETVDFDGTIQFAFQGGEPTLWGLENFRRFAAMVKEKNTRHIPVIYAIQTNGLALDQSWADFLRENHFLVGISMDGDKELHDEFRLDSSGKGTWNRVQASLSLLQKNGVACNLLCVVTKRCAKKAVKVYHALQKTGVRYLQFIPCLDPLGEPRGQRSWSLSPADYGNFLCALFDQWYRDFEQGQYISIRLFDDYIHMLMGLPPGACAASGSCGAYLVVEGDGSVYPCDFYVLDQWKLGNLNQDQPGALFQNSKERQFLEAGLEHPSPCKSCSWYRLCNGGCKRDWETDSQGNTRNYYCEAFRVFFSYAYPRMSKIARRLSSF